MNLFEVRINDPSAEPNPFRIAIPEDDVVVAIELALDKWDIEVGGSVTRIMCKKLGDVVIDRGTRPE